MRKKRPNIEFSVENPEVSSSLLDGVPVSTPKVVRPMSDVSFDGVSILGLDEDSRKPGISEDEVFNDNDGYNSQKAVIDIFEVYPILDKLRLHPLASNGRQLTKYYLRKNGKVNNGKGRIVLVKNIDWDETYTSIRDVVTSDPRFFNYITNRKRSAKAFPECNKPLDVWKLIGEKRKRSNTSAEGDDANRSKQRLEDSFLFDRATSTTSDEGENKRRLLWIIFKNKELLESNGLRKSISPVLKGTNKSSSMDQDGCIWIDGSTVSVFGKDSNRVKPAITEKVNWGSSLAAFVEMVKNRGLELVVVANNDKEINITDFKPTDNDVESRHGVMSGIDADMDQGLSNADTDAKKILSDYYTQLQAKRIKIPFRLKPVVDTKKGGKPHPTYYFSEPMIHRPLNIRNDQHKPVSGNAWSHLMKTIRWMDTFTVLLDGLEDIDRYLKDHTPRNDEQNLDQIRRKNLDDNLEIINVAIRSTAQEIKRQSIELYEYDDKADQLQKLHDDSEASFQDYGEAQKRYEAAKQTVKTTNTTTARSALKAAASAMKATKAVYLAKSKKYSRAFQDSLAVGTVSGSGLKGRGLRGAGVAPLDGVVRRGRTYNLNEIQGLATPSAYVYRQLGSKYIRLPDLDAQTLVIVQPNRRKCGPKCTISDSLQSMIKTLVYKQHIDQPAYDKLTIDDKKMFKEILAITHLQYNFRDKLEGPFESLRAEYDKLKGEMELGNDNPSIIKQLKSLSVDMYSNRLISDSEFKDIITRLL